MLTEFVVDATEIRVLLIKPEGNVDYYNVTCFNGPNMCGFYHLNASENQQEVNFTDLTAYQDYSFSIVTVSGKKHVTKDYSKQTAQSGKDCWNILINTYTTSKVVLQRKYHVKFRLNKI